MLVSDVCTISRLLGIRDFQKICLFTSKVPKSSTAFGRVLPVGNDVIRRMDCFDICIKDGSRRRYFRVSKKIFA